MIRSCVHDELQFLLQVQRRFLPKLSLDHCLGRGKMGHKAQGTREGVLFTARLMQEQAAAIFVVEVKRSGSAMTNQDPLREPRRISFLSLSGCIDERWSSSSQQARVVQDHHIPAER
jgi:hypothetical protein